MVVSSWSSLVEVHSPSTTHSGRRGGEGDAGGAGSDGGGGGEVGGGCAASTPSDRTSSQPGTTWQEPGEPPA